MKNIAYIIVTGIIWGFTSCKSPDSLFEEFLVPGGLYYPGPVKNVITKSGDKRIEISWEKSADPKVVETRIFWNNYSDSVQVTVDAGVDAISMTIDPIDENTHSFMIHTYDAEGNVSVPVETFGTAYGDIYRSALVNRVMRSYVYDGQDLSLNWMGAPESERGVHLTYSDIHGAEHTIFVDISDTETFIEEFDVDQPLKYYTVYQPDSTCLDMFQTQTAETMIDPVIQIFKPWAEYNLPGDVEFNGSYPMPRMWDGLTTNFNLTVMPATFPNMFSWDLGLRVQLKDMRLWPRPNNDDRWNGGHPKVFEIWGSLAPNDDGSLDESWSLLGRFECIRPSGAVPGTDMANQADLDLAAMGIRFEFIPINGIDPTETTVRYLRFRTIEVFAMTNPTTQYMRVSLAELTFTGKVIK